MIEHFKQLFSISSVFVSHPDASTEATHIISAISEVPSVPAPCDTEGAAIKGIFANTCSIKGISV